jgi:SRSO17 transposase
VELAHSRWPIEQFYEDAKGECGLDHYQGRRWWIWPHDSGHIWEARSPHLSYALKATP